MTCSCCGGDHQGRCGIADGEGASFLLADSRPPGLEADELLDYEDWRCNSASVPATFEDVWGRNAPDDP